MFALEAKRSPVADSERRDWGTGRKTINARKNKWAVSDLDREEYVHV
jgi:hypothetical protein